MMTSGLGLALVERFEGYFARPYNDPVGYATVGFGHLLHYSQVDAADRVGRWVPGQHTPGVLTRAEAGLLLLHDLGRDYEPAINRLRLPLNQHQYDALVSFVYNVGVGGVGADTQVGKALRRHDWRAAADHLLDWDKAGGQVLEGLRIRREQERALFLRPVGRFEGYTPHEEQMILAFDGLAGHTSPAAATARAELRRQMRQDCAQIAHAARFHGGWDVNRRRTRYAALMRRVGGSSRP